MLRLAWVPACAGMTEWVRHLMTLSRYMHQHLTWLCDVSNATCKQKRKEPAEVPPVKTVQIVSDRLGACALIELAKPRLVSSETLLGVVWIGGYPRGTDPGLQAVCQTCNLDLRQNDCGGCDQRCFVVGPLPYLRVKNLCNGCIGYRRYKSG